ncbi:MAG: hypothetical protein SGILL_001471 [Bacillariaceae sp.]
MKLSNSTVTYLFLALAGFASTANATCHTYFYQVGSNSAQELNVEAYDHDDISCMVENSDTDLKEGEWISVKANKDHESTIQVYIIDAKDDLCGADYCGAEIKSCDGSLQSEGECGLRKATCNQHYVLYAEDDNLVCEAATDSSGTILTNSSGDPYCADSSTSSTDSNDDSDCKNITFPDKGYGDARRALLRGAH